MFPEDGLMAFGMSRDAIQPYLQQVSVNNTGSNPCLDGLQTDRQFILYRLSCMARDNGMYVVANFGTIEECNDTRHCPPDGRFQYNTNVVFDSNGSIVSVYHKWSLFYEDAFDFPVAPEYAVFTTPFGTFASIVCFDILFKEPAVDLVQVHNVTNILMPTAWRSILPEMSGIGYHESWAVRMGVNLMTSELHVPAAGFAGSGIFSGADGALAYSNRYEILSGAELLVASLPSSPARCHRSLLDVPSTNASGSDDTATFQSEMEGNQMTFTLLRNDEDSLYLTSTNVSCHLRYRFDLHNQSDMFAFGIFEGLHVSSFNSSIQVCALVRCADSRDTNSCGASTRQTQSTFALLEMQGSFSTDYIFPSVLGDRGDLVSGWNFTLDEQNMRGRLAVLNSSERLLSAMLFTRVYDEDHNVIDRYYHNSGAVGDASSSSSSGRRKSSVVAEGSDDVMPAQPDVTPNGGESASAVGLVIVVVATVLFGVAATVAALTHYTRTRTYGAANYRGYERI